MTRPIQENCNGVSYLARPGTGPTVAFLHGIGSNATSFAHLFDILPSHWNLLAWNAPGYLASDPLDDMWPSPADYAHRLARFLDDLGVKELHLVGHSLGALIAAAFARHYPKRLSSLVLASLASGYCVPRRGDMPAKVGARIEELNRLGPAAFAKARAANLVYDPDRFEDVVARVEAVMADVNPHGYAQAVHLLATGDLLADLAQVPIRPGFIIGVQDRVTPIAQTNAAAEAWQAAHGSRPSVFEIQDAGHAVYLQKPKEFCAAVIELMVPEHAGELHTADKNERV